MFTHLELYQFLIWFCLEKVCWSICSLQECSSFLFSLERFAFLQKIIIQTVELLCSFGTNVFVYLWNSQSIMGEHMLEVQHLLDLTVQGILFLANKNTFFSAFGPSYSFLCKVYGHWELDLCMCMCHNAINIFSRI